MKLFTDKTFSKYRKFLTLSYTNPCLNKSQFIEEFFWKLVDNERVRFKSETEVDYIKTHYPASDILQIYSQEIMDIQNSFCDNPNPQRSAVFKWSNVYENPFFELWKHAYHKESFIELYFAIANEFLENEYVKTAEIAEALHGSSDNTAINKNLKNQFGPMGVIKSFTSGVNGDQKGNYHSINILPVELDFSDNKIYNKILDYSKTGPCSVIGLFLLDKFFDKEKFKRPPIKCWEKKFMLSSLDSEVMYKIFNAIQLGMEIKLSDSLYDDSVIPLCIVQNMQSGSFDLIYKKYDGRYLTKPISSFQDVKRVNFFFNHDEEIAKIKDLLPKLWECEYTDPFYNPQYIFIRLAGLENFDDIKEYLSPVFDVYKKDNCIEIVGECFKALLFIPVLRSFLGQIKDFGFYKEVKDKSEKIKLVNILWRLDYLSVQSFYDSLKKLFFQYSIFLERNLIGPKREPPPDYDVSFMIGRPERELPEGFVLKEYEEEPVLFSPFYAKDFIEAAKNENMPLPITTAESRWLYSIIDYDKADNDGFDELRKYFEEQKIEKLFTKSSFIQIRKGFANRVYEKLSGEKCFLEVSKELLGNSSDESSRLFIVFPQCRDNLNLTKDGNITTWFYYDIEDEAKIIPMLFSVGAEIKVTKPQAIVNKIINLLNQQIEFFRLRTEQNS